MPKFGIDYWKPKEYSEEDEVKAEESQARRDAALEYMKMKLTPFTESTAEREFRSENTAPAVPSDVDPNLLASTNMEDAATNWKKNISLEELTKGDVDGKQEMVNTMEDNSAKATEELNKMKGPRDVATDYIKEQAQPSAMEDALRLKANQELLAGIGQAGGTAGAAISGTKSDTSFWDKMRSGSGYMAQHERKKEEIEQKNKDRALLQKEKAQSKQSETDRKELSKYGLARQGIGRGTAKIVGNLNKKRRTIRTIQGDLASYRNGTRVLTPEQRVDLSTRISQVLTAGAPPLALIENTQFRTIGTAMASLGQKLTNLPLEAYSDEQLNEIQKQMDDLEGANKMYWQELQADLWNTQASELALRNPERAAYHLPEISKHVYLDEGMKATPKYQQDLKDKKGRDDKSQAVNKEAMDASSAEVEEARAAAAKGDQGAIGFLKRRGEM